MMKTPPTPWLCVLYRTLKSGAHVSILAYEQDADYLVISSVNHGTVRNSRYIESPRSTLSDAVLRIKQLSEIWEKADSSPVTPSSKAKEYFYTDSRGTILEAVSREMLFQKFDHSEIGWSTQIWNGSSWSSLGSILGFPQEEDVVMSADMLKEDIYR